MFQNVFRFYTYMYIEYWMTMDFSKPYYKGLMLYNLKGGLDSAELGHCFNSAFGNDTVPERTAQDWLPPFCTKSDDIKDRLRQSPFST